jgi:membrane-associated protease RseP (regulator of RpoE activity)
VKLKDSREETLAIDDRADAFNHQATWKQVLVPLAGNGCLVLFAMGALGLEGWASFVRGFAQVFEGAVSPLGVAQHYLESLSIFCRERPFIAILALVAAKLAALNLLPFGPFDGGQVLTTLARFGRPEMKAEESIWRFGIFLTLALFLAWLIAIGWFVFGDAS